MKQHKHYKHARKKVHLNKKFLYVTAAFGLFILGSGIQIFDSGSRVTGAVIGASRQDVGLLGFGILAAGIFLTGFAVHQLVSQHK